MLMNSMKTKSRCWLPTSRRNTRRTLTHSSSKRGSFKNWHNKSRVEQAYRKEEWSLMKLRSRLITNRSRLASRLSKMTRIRKKTKPISRSKVVSSRLRMTASQPSKKWSIRTLPLSKSNKYCYWNNNNWPNNSKSKFMVRRSMTMKKNRIRWTKTSTTWGISTVKRRRRRSSLRATWINESQVGK